MNLPYKLEKFLSGSKIINYKKGEIILRPGDTPQGISFIKSGYIKDYSISKDGEELILIIFKPEDFFPIRWTLLDKQSTHYFEAMTDVELRRIPRDQFIDFVKDNSDVFYELTKFILVRLGGIMQRMEYLAFGNAEEKVASILSICAERFGKKDKNRTVIQVSLTHKDIANLVGVTRETVSLELKKLEKKGIIGYEDKLIVIKNGEGLAEKALL